MYEQPFNKLFNWNQ